MEQDFKSEMSFNKIKPSFSHLKEQFLQLFTAFRESIDTNFQKLIFKLEELHDQEAFFLNYQQDLRKKEEELFFQEQKLQLDRRKAEELYHLPEEILKINVGGQFFSCLHSTLTHVNDSMLASMFSGRYPITTDSNGHFFIDRDPKLFRYILNYLRNDILIFPSKSDEKANLEIELDYFGLKTIDETISDKKIYIVGGDDIQKTCLSSIECFNLNTQKFQLHLANMTYGRSGLAVVYLSGYIYAIGGCSSTQTVLDLVESYHIESGTWRNVESMNKCRYGLAAVVTKENIFVMGGKDHRRISQNSVEYYDPLEKIWKIGHSMNYPRSRTSAVYLQNKIFVLGGVNNEDQTLNSVEYFDLIINEWIVVANMQTTRYAHCAVSTMGKIYVLAGRDENDTALYSVEIYDPILNTWNFSTPLSLQRIAAAAVVDNNQIYIIGGHNGIKRQNTILCYDTHLHSCNIVGNLSVPRLALSSVIIDE